MPHCGDGKVAGSEKCDDGNTVSGDGWSADCSTVESGWVWSGGSATLKDVCAYCTAGFYQNSLSNPTTWVTHCGDGIRTGSEKWDDGNTVNGDGWSSDCLTIESSWVWTGGSLTSKDTCTKWYSSSGYYQNNLLNPTEWVTHCGDGIRAGSEKWDDGNNISGDGWSSDCSSIDSGWAWSLNQTQAKDICTFCTSGLYQNNPSNPTLWVPHWGDSKVASIEAWDDGNTVNGDGCANNWETIENNWIWINGNTTHKSDCSEWDVGYEPNSDHSKWIIAEIDIEIQSYLVIILSIIGTSIVVNIAFVIIEWATFQSTFCNLNQIQLFILLILLNINFPTKITQYLSGMISYIYLKAIFYPPEYGNFDILLANSYLKSIMKYEQKNNNLKLLTFDDQCTFNNILGYFNIIVWFFIIHISWKITIKVLKKTAIIK